MKLDDYIRGRRRGKEAHRIEREAMDDPFLWEALEGYDEVEGDHAQALERLREAVARRDEVKQPLRRELIVRLSVAAGLALIILSGGYLLYRFIPEARQYAVETPVPVDTAATLAQNLDTVEKIAEFDIVAPVEEDVAVERAPKEKIAVVSDILNVVKNDAKVATNTAQADKAAVKSTTQPQVKAEAKQPTTVAKNLATDNQADTETAAIEIGYSTTKKADLTGSVGTVTTSPLTSTSAAPAPAESASGVATERSDPAYAKYLRDNTPVVNNIYGEPITGEVVIELSVDSNGKPRNVKIVKGLTADTDAEALRLVRRGPRWNITDRDVRVTVRFGAK